jgi:diguanylate cyclase (GGDEF)-like protein
VSRTAAATASVRPLRTSAERADPDVVPVPLQRRRATAPAITSARQDWLRRFDDPEPPVVARDVADRIAAALHGAAVPPLVESARGLGVLRAQQGHAVAGVVEDVVALRMALEAADPRSRHRLAELCDLVVVSATTAYVDELRLVLESKATRDALTGLANRVAFHEAVNHEIAAASRHAAPTVLLVDLDKFKQVNDTHGHLAGDAVLVAVSRLLTRRMREMDVVTRLGGDEFAVVLPRTGQRAALTAARRLVRSAHDDAGLQVGDVRVTFSIGIGWLPRPHTVDELVAVADAALYRVKAEGGDGVAVGTPASVHQVPEQQ